MSMQKCLSIASFSIFGSFMYSLNSLNHLLVLNQWFIDIYIQSRSLMYPLIHTYVHSSILSIDIIYHSFIHPFTYSFMKLAYGSTMDKVMNEHRTYIPGLSKSGHVDVAESHHYGEKSVHVLIVFATVKKSETLKLPLRR